MSACFKLGDLAVTVNSRAPILNNGHVVRIVRVLGSVPRWKMEFGYEIERLDGQPFIVVTNNLGVPGIPGGKRCAAHHWQLRPLVETLPRGRARSRAKSSKRELETTE